AVTSPRGQESAWPRMTIQARTNGAAAARIRSTPITGNVLMPLQLVLPTPHAQSVASLLRWTTLGLVESEYHSRKTLMTSTAAAAMPRISERSSLEVSIARRVAPRPSPAGHPRITLSQPVGSRQREPLGTDSAAAGHGLGREPGARRARRGRR